MIITMLLILLWLSSGVIAAGILFAYFQGGYPDLAREDWREDLGNSLLLGLLFGPVSLAISFFMTGFCKYGWKLKP